MNAEIINIYRGENILNGAVDRKRILLEKIAFGNFPSDLINGGDPYILAEIGIFDGVIQHVGKNFEIPNLNSKKHFISFSEKKERAERYAIHFVKEGKLLPNDYVNDMYPDFYNSCNSQAIDKHIFEHTLHFLVNLNIQDKERVSGLPYEGLYLLRYGKNLNGKLLLIDVSSFLIHLEQGYKSQISDKISFLNAKRLSEEDKEWLVLPLDLIPSVPNQKPSCSALIQASSILEFEFYVNSEWDHSQPESFILL